MKMSDKIGDFAALHIPGDPLILVNIWDAGSAKAVAAAGAKAIATGSFGVAGAQGRADGEDFPLADVFENLARILAVTDLPVTIDMESGYGADPAAVGASVARARDAGAAGINMEDRLPGESDLLPVAEAVARYRAAADTGIFVNARRERYRSAR
jgi:2-methylisocitrate lyase-like PEP mutase family enzyme